MIRLPVELILHILSFITLDASASIRRVCRKLQDLFELRGETIYRGIALSSGFLPAPNISFENLIEIYSERSLAGVSNWKLFCKRRRLLSRSWLGNAPSTLEQHGNRSGSRVHRFKVDELAGYIISTSIQGSLVVTDLASGEILWSLNEESGYVRPFAHCEYGNGFVIFDRLDGRKEVWRRACDYDSCPLPVASPPSQTQLSAYQESLGRHPTLRGQFRPWLLIAPPTATRAYRFVYPTLLVSSYNEAFLWDIPSGRLIQTIENIQSFNVSGEVLGDINYVELSNSHVVICGSDSLRMFSRHDGRCALEIRSNQPSYGAWEFELGLTHSLRIDVGASLQPCDVTRRQVTAYDNGIYLYDQFVAAHISSCGSHLAAMLSSSRVLIVHDFEKVLRGEAELRENTFDIQLGSPRFRSIYLAYENGRVAVATGSGVFTVQVSDDAEANPVVHVALATRLTNVAHLRSISCLQMTDTGLFVNCYPSDDPEADLIGFNQRLSYPGTYIGTPNNRMVVVMGENRALPLRSEIFDLNVVPKP